MSNTYLPISIALSGRRCLIVGGGNVALRKVETLLDFGAAVTVVAPQPAEKIEYFAGRKMLELVKREYRSPEAAEYDLVISASDIPSVNEAVWADCDRSGTIINVVDNPALCSFIFPAIVRRDVLTVAVSTSGQAPFLSGRLKLILEDLFSERWARIAKLAGIFREKVRNQTRDPQQRACRYERFLDTDWKEVLAGSSDEEIEGILDRLIEGVGDDRREENDAAGANDDSGIEQR